MRGYSIQSFKGNGCEIGLKMGQSLKGRFDLIIDNYMKIVEKTCNFDNKMFESNSFKWLYKLPEEFIIELESLAYGSKVKLSKLVKWIYSHKLFNGCGIGFVLLHEGNAWIGRNHDLIEPNIGRNVNVIIKDGCIPVVLFGNEGSIFSEAGFNSQKLWLHYNSLPADDSGDEAEKFIPSLIFIRLALQKCKTLNDLENLLKYTLRDGGMNLLAVDGKDNSFCIYECTCKGFKKRRNTSSYMIMANHFAENETETLFSNNRSSQMETMLKEINIIDPLKDLTYVLAGYEAEQNNEFSGTVYSTLACPALDLYYLATNGFPTSNQASYEEIIIPPFIS